MVCSGRWQRLSRWTGWGVALGALAIAGCGGGSDATGKLAATTAPQTASAAAGPVQVEPMTRSALDGVASSTLRQRRGLTPPARGLTLSEMSPAKLAAEKPLLALAGAPRKIGFARTVSQTATPSATAAQLDWQSLPDGRHVASISVTSPLAKAVRLGLLVRSLPADATVRVYAQTAAVAQEMAAADMLAALQRNVAAGDTTDAAHTYWTPLVEGAEATLEIELPAGVATAGVEVAIPQLSHLFESPMADPIASDVNVAKIGEAGRCEVDVSCTTAYQSESNAVAKMSFVENGLSYQCSGTLLNDRSGSGLPYFLSANHCISTQTSASTLQTFWFYRSTTCNAQVLNPGYQILTGGAALLYASASTDTSFMRLNGTPPVGAVYAGWAVDAPALATPVFGLHFPEGDLQKVSTGTIESFQTCTNSTDGSETFYCSKGTQANSNFLNVTLTSGSTEAGSSGSPIFKTVGGTRYVTGQLYGGTASCRVTTGSNIYGRFDVAYNASLNQWLNAFLRSPVYRFYNASTGAHFFTNNVTERDTVIATNPAFKYEGIGFYAYSQSAVGLSPVYRFYNTTTRAHFYTVSEAERDQVLRTLPQFSLEGVAWYAQLTEAGGAVPLYRFYKTNNGTHFYTPSAAERDEVIRTQPSFVYEGVAYDVWTSN